MMSCRRCCFSRRAAIGLLGLVIHSSLLTSVEAAVGHFRNGFDEVDGCFQPGGCMVSRVSGNIDADRDDLLVDDDYVAPSVGGNDPASAPTIDGNLLEKTRAPNIDSSGGDGSGGDGSGGDGSSGDGDGSDGDGSGGVDYINPESLSCPSSVNGVYGDLSGDPSVVTWLYTVQTKSSMNDTEFLANVLPDLETEMLDSLMPYLFRADCTDPETERRRYLTQRHRRLAVIGMSAQPTDSIDDRVQCGLENCYGMIGRMTMYNTVEERRRSRRTQEEGSGDLSDADRIRESLKVAMENGQFDNKGEILTVSYVEDDDTLLEVDGIDGDSDGARSTDRTVLTYVVVAAGAGLLMVLASLICCRPNHKSRGAAVRSVERLVEEPIEERRKYPVEESETNDLVEDNIYFRGPSETTSTTLRR